MAITINSDNTTSITLEEYIEHVSNSVDLSDPDQVLASAEPLKALANNRRFLVDMFNRELLSGALFQPLNFYSSQTLALGRGNGFFMRANMWLPPSSAGAGADWESKLFAYDRPHDHNYSFLTVGYLGPGYTTRIYEYDPETVIGYPGEKVALRFLEDTTLNQGKIMLYRACRDIHTQGHPREFSVSVNLLIVNQGLSEKDQYWFDLEAGTIKDYLRQNQAASQVMLCRLARYVGNGSTFNALESVASGHHFPRVRVAAYESLAAMEASSAARIWEQALEDQDPIVCHAARQTLDRLSREHHPEM